MFVPIVPQQIVVHSSLRSRQRNRWRRIEPVTASQLHTRNVATAQNYNSRKFGLNVIEDTEYDFSTKQLHSMYFFKIRQNGFRRIGTDARRPSIGILNRWVTWNGGTDFMSYDYWQNVAVDDKQRRIMMCSGPSGTEDLLCWHRCIIMCMRKILTAADKLICFLVWSSGGVRSPWTKL